MFKDIIYHYSLFCIYLAKKQFCPIIIIMDNRTQFNPTRLQFICDETYLLPYFRPHKRDSLEAIIVRNNFSKAVVTMILIGRNP